MWRSPKLLASAQHHRCQAEGCSSTHGVVAAHSNAGRHGKGMGIKAADAFVAFLCFACHSWVDQGRASQEQKTAVWMGAFERTVPLIWKYLDDEARAMVQAELAHRG